MKGDYEVNKDKPILSIFIKQLLRYLSVALILIISCSVLVWQTYQNARQSQLNVVQTNMQNGLSLLNDQAARSQVIASNLLQNENFQKAMLIHGTPRPDELIFLKKVQELIKQFVLSNQVDEDIYLLFRDNDCFVTINLCTDKLERAYPVLFSYEGYDTVGFRDLSFASSAQQRYLSAQTINSHYTSGKTYIGLTSLVKVSSLSAAQPKCVLGVITNQDIFINAFLDKTQQEESAIIVSSSDGTILLSHNQSNFDQQEQGRYLISSITTEAGITATVSIPLSFILKNIYSTIQSAILITVFSVVIAVIAALAFSMRTANAIKPIIDTVYNHTHKSYKRENEYGYIGEAIRYMGIENDEQASLIKELRSSALTCTIENLLILGVYSQKEEREAETLLEKNFDIFRIMNIHYVCDDSSLENQLFVYIENKLNAINGLGHVIMLNTRPQEITALIFSPKESIENDTKELILMAHGELKKHVVLQIGLSRALSGIRQVRKGYLEANHVLYFNRVGKVSGIWSFQNKIHEEDQFDFSLLLKLHDLILRGDEVAAIALVSEFILPPELYDRSEAEIVQRFYLLRQILENIEQSAQPTKEISSVLPVYQTGINVSVQLDSLIQHIKTLCNDISERQRKGNQELKNRLEQYINEHVYDPGLNAAMIAQSFMISEKYVFSLIKEQTGKSLGTLVEEIRLDEAERLLSHTNLSNSIIWQQCGFGSENTFYRAFSKRRGVSPALWRKQQEEVLK